MRKIISTIVISTLFSIGVCGNFTQAKEGDTHMSEASSIVTKKHKTECCSDHKVEKEVGYFNAINQNKKFEKNFQELESSKKKRPKKQLIHVKPREKIPIESTFEKYFEAVVLIE